MWQLLTVEKDAQTLSAARKYIENDRIRLREQLGIGSPFDVALAFEQRNLQDVAEVIIETADMRKESRGPHYRGDFPDRNDNEWMTNLFVTRTNDELNIRKNWINEEQGWDDLPGDIRISPWG